MRPRSSCQHVARVGRLYDVVISYDTYPHVNMRARGREAASMLVRMILGGESFETSLAKVPLLS